MITDLSGDADGRHAAELLYDQRQGLPVDRDHSHEARRNPQGAFHRHNNGFIHPMHIHGGPFEVVARDGETIPASARFFADTANVGPGQRYDVIWKARERGKWLIHCHIPHHTTNNNTERNGGGGLMVIIDVE